MFYVLVAELCVLRTFGGVDFSLIFICAQSVPEVLWDRLRASIQFPVVPKRAQYARFSGEYISSRTVRIAHVWGCRLFTDVYLRAIHAGRISVNRMGFAELPHPAKLAE